MPFSIHLPETLVHELDAVALRMNIRRNAVVRQAVERFVVEALVSQWPTSVRAHMEESLVGNTQGTDASSTPELKRRSSPLKFRRTVSL